MGWARGQLDYTTKELSTIIQEINNAIGLSTRNYFTIEIITKWNIQIEYGKIAYDENDKLDNCTKYIKETKE
jgi:hypothetical protein